MKKSIKKWLRTKTKTVKKWAVAVIACYLLYLGAYAHFRTYAWQDSETLKKEFRKLIDEDLLKQYQDENPNPNDQ
jgi:hypothetical protein